MPVFHVTGPDGHTYEINAPEGATEQDAIQYAQANLAQPSGGAPAPTQPQPSAAQPEQSFMDKLGDQLTYQYDQLNQFGNNLVDPIAHHFASIPVGLAQLGMHGAKAVGDVIAPADNTLSGLITGKQDGNWIDRQTAAYDKWVQDRENAYQ
ncbi:hypothetical protein J2T07_002730 [Luteibacter jiangsuensis]|uniref:Uncharacterized protein n=1 Tax=Luteibacter jiangsuensis TaxID=637577 RepID=A0ABT9T0L6_9GAMM|nr:hypothetical protein [Luteibacter jiangsuensis]MDQ0010540.1 hypothetical protein [Luteibacter jiangsuensis]